MTLILTERKHTRTRNWAMMFLVALPLIVWGIGLGAALLRPSRITDTYGSATVVFELRPGNVIASQGCVDVHWNTEQIKTVHYNGASTDGEDTQTVCTHEGFTRQELRVVFRDKTQKVYSLDIAVLAYTLPSLALTFLVSLIILAYQRRWLSRDSLFLVAAAGSMVALRLILFDNNFVSLALAPNHDMLNGLPLFSTSLHSMRLSGDIAWWYSPSLNGYAQYFLGFLVPVAPNYGSPVFIVWMQIARLLSGFDIVIPEYLQYMAVTYLVFPFLASLALGYMARQIFASRWTILFILIVYNLSGIGLWNGAWFYFQEAFSLFWLLGSFLTLCRKPSVGNGLWFTLAVVNQVASFNYWTLYNIPFILIFIGSYLVVYWRRVVWAVHRLQQTVISMPRIWQAALGSIVICILLWGSVVALVYVEQNSQYTRRDASIDHLLLFRPSLRAMTLDLFNPVLDDVINFYDKLSQNNIHVATYIGIFLLPLLSLLTSTHNTRRTRWIMACIVGVLLFCLAPILLVRLIERLPVLLGIVHLFRFYPQYLQLMLLFGAAVMLDWLITQPLSGRFITRIKQTIKAIGALSLILIVTFGAVLWSSWTSPSIEPEVFNYVMAVVVRLFFASAALGVVFISKMPPRHWLGFCFGLMALIDLSGYYQYASQQDQVFTRLYRDISQDNWTTVQQPFLRRPVQDPDLTKGFKQQDMHYYPALLEFWPDNHFSFHRQFIRLARYFGDCELGATEWCILPFYTRFYENRIDNPSSPFPLVGQLFADAPLDFYTEDQTVVDEDITLLDEAFKNHQPLLMLQAPLTPVPAASKVAGTFSYQMQNWHYNGATFEVTAPASGYLLIRQIYDPAWKVTIDGNPVSVVPANAVNMAISIASGPHTIRLEFSPLSRQVYWVAVTLTELMIVVLLGLWWRTKSNRSSLQA